MLTSLYIYIYIYFTEINFIWAAHQTHHSSEDYNLTTALRQSITQNLNTVVCIIVIIALTQHTVSPRQTYPFFIPLVYLFLSWIFCSTCCIFCSYPVQSSVSVLDSY